MSTKPVNVEDYLTMAPNQQYSVVPAEIDATTTLRPRDDVSGQARPEREAGRARSCGISHARLKGRDEWDRRASRRQIVDIGRILDDGPWTTVQKVVVFLAALSIVVDGLDSELIGFAIPQIVQETGVTRGDFALVVALGLVGMAIGSAAAGLFADCFGRRLVIIGSVAFYRRPLSPLPRAGTRRHHWARPTGYRQLSK